MIVVFGTISSRTTTHAIKHSRDVVPETKLTSYVNGAIVKCGDGRNKGLNVSTVFI